MQIRVKQSPIAGQKSFCSWDRLTRDADLFGLKPNETIVALEVDEKGIQAVIERTNETLPKTR